MGNILLRALLLTVAVGSVMSDGHTTERKAGRGQYDRFWDASEFEEPAPYGGASPARSAAASGPDLLVNPNLLVHTEDDVFRLLNEGQLLNADLARGASADVRLLFVQMQDMERDRLQNEQRRAPTPTYVADTRGYVIRNHGDIDRIVQEGNILDVDADSINDDYLRQSVLDAQAAHRASLRDARSKVAGRYERDGVDVVRKTTVRELKGTHQRLVENAAAGGGAASSVGAPTAADEYRQVVQNSGLSMAQRRAMFEKKDK